MTDDSSPRSPSEPTPAPPPTAGRRVPGALVALAWAACVAAAWAGPGEYWAARFEGIDPARIPYGGIFGFAGALLVALAITPLWVRDRVAADGAPASPRRRLFVFAGGVAAGLVASALGAFARVFGWWTVSRPVTEGVPVRRTAKERLPEWRDAHIAAHRPLGRTGFAVSDIALGSGALAYSPVGAAIARAAIERGVNYFDTAPDYAATGTETLLGQAIAGRRDRMFLATKFCTGQGHLPAGSSVADYVRVVEESLGRLRTDYVDLVHVHACDSIERLMDPNAHEAFDRLREQGKARFLGFSSHTPNLVAVANRAIESGRFAVMMLAYHFGGWSELGSVIDRAHAAGMGVVAMKTLKGAKHRGMEEFVGRRGAYSQAAFRWVLSNPSVSCLVASFYDPQHVDEYIHASGKPLRDDDVALLEEYDRAIAGTHCLAHCGACLDRCPEGLRIDDVLRHRMYFEDYGTQKRAMQDYARLEKRADVCIGCSAPCAGACPFGIAIQERAIEAHRLLTLA
ncbi:MAG: aldo/keto reductase [Myxococcota bacterium]